MVLLGLPGRWLVWKFVFGFELFIVFFLNAFGDVLIGAHVGHIDFFGIFLVDEDFSLEKFEAFLFIDGGVDVEGLEEEIEELVFVDELVVVVGDLPVDEERPEKVDEDHIDDGILVDGLVDGQKLARFPNVHELQQEPFKLQVIENLFVVFLQENEVEVGVHQVRVQFLPVEGRIGFVDLVAEDEELEVEGPDIGIGVIQEHLQFPGGVVEELLEEIWVGLCLREHVLAGAVLELAQRSTVLEHFIHLYKINKIQLVHGLLKLINSTRLSPSSSSSRAFWSSGSQFRPMSPAHLKMTSPVQLHSQTAH